MPINKLLIFHMKNICGVSSTPKFSMNHRADEAARTATSLSGCTHGLTRPGSGPDGVQFMRVLEQGVHSAEGSGNHLLSGVSPGEKGTWQTWCYLSCRRADTTEKTRCLSRERSGEQ